MTRAPGPALVPAVVLAALVAGRMVLPQLWSTPTAAAWATVFAAICLQALPFVGLGVVVAAVLGAVPVDRFVRWSARHPALAVLAATAVAYPGHPAMVLGRVAASALLAGTIGGWWQCSGRPPILAAAHPHPHPHPGAELRLVTALVSAGTQLGRSLAWLTLGALAAASLVVLVPHSTLVAFGDRPGLDLLAAAVLAVLLAICSTADAFVASALTGFSLTAQLVFLVVGPSVDVKLIAMQVGSFGPRFARLFLPVTFCCAVGAAGLVGTVVR